MTAAACAATAPPAANRSAVGVAASPDALAGVTDGLLRRLASDDFAGATQLFSDHLREVLPPAKLQSVWQALKSEHGPLRSWSEDERVRKGEMVRFVFKTAFEKGAMRTTIVVDETTRRIVGLFFASESPPAAASNVPSRSVKVGSPPYEVEGTLTLPRAVGTKHPAVLLVPGSGPQDRDETTGGVKPFRDIAEALSAEGLVVLRFDKRTYAHRRISNVAQWTVEEEEIADAVAAVETLRSQPEVDSGAIILIGHSLGALVLPEIAERAGPIAGMALLAPPGRPITEVVLDQARRKHLPDLAALEQGRRDFSTATPDAWWFGAPVRYWRDLEARDEIARARRQSTPISVFRGENDENVSSEDVDLWRRGLDPHQVDVVTLPGLDHLFVRAGRVGGAHVDASLLDGLRAFIRKCIGHGSG